MKTGLNFVMKRGRRSAFAILLSIGGLLILSVGVVWAIGELLWQDQVDFVGNHDFGDYLTVRDDQLFAAGRVSHPNGEWDWLVRAYDSKTGALQWQEQFDLANGYDTIFDIKADDSQLYVVGEGVNDGGIPDAITRVYNKRTGDLLWQDQFDLIGEYDFNTAVAVQSGVVFVAALSDGSLLNFDWLVRAFDARDGSLLWQNQYDVAGKDDEPWAMAVSGPRLFVAGIGTTAAGDDDALVRAYHAQTGSLLWQFQFDQAGGEEQAYNVVTDGNHVFVGGWVENAAGNIDWMLWAFKAEDGTLIWQQQVDPAGGFDALLDIAVHNKQLFAVGSITNGSGGRDSLVNVYDTRTGNVLWQNQFDLAGGTDTASAVAVDGRQVVVTSNSVNALGNQDWVVRAFDTRNGALLWQDQFDLAGDRDTAGGIVIERGRAFVLGGSLNAAGNTDWIIRSYKAR